MENWFSLGKASYRLILVTMEVVEMSDVDLASV
jgi:hypothetical protein